MWRLPTLTCTIIIFLTRELVFKKYNFDLKQLGTGFHTLSLSFMYKCLVRPAVGCKKG